MSLKVLIADHDWHFAEQARTYLESHAHLVVCESDPHEAIERARHWQPDLVIIAAEHVKNGQLNALYSMKNRPAILLTEHMEKFAQAWQAWQKGGDDLLIKPVLSTDDIHQSVVAALENATTGKRRTKQAVSA